MGILDGIVEWIAEQVMAGLDLITTSVLGALGCDMAVFLRYFPAGQLPLNGDLVQILLNFLLLLRRHLGNDLQLLAGVPRHNARGGSGRDSL